MRKLKVENKHWHSEQCENFEKALKFGHITIIEGEPQITGKLPKNADIGNVLTGEKYNPQDFALNMVICFCPFCSKEIYKFREEE